MNLINTAKNFGCHDVVLLEETPIPRHLEYLDLLKISGAGKLKVDAVAEFQSRPLLYIVSDQQLRDSDTQNMMDLQSLLANRGERAYIGVLSSGELNVYPVNYRPLLVEGYKKTIKRDSSEAPLFFQSLINGIFNMEGLPETSDYVFTTIHDLMTKSSNDLIHIYGLNPLDVLSFLGRALFFRFLWDRKIVRKNELHSICSNAESLSDCFCNVANSISTCTWLDETFNGDLLPLSGDYSEVFSQADEKTAGKLFLHLQAILEGWEHTGSGQFQTKIGWDDLDFAHIPIGVLSQVYENFSRQWDSHQSKNTSVYYTPKNIAHCLVDEALEGITDKKNARILDPSCGAGIFLVLAFRKLFATHWEHEGTMPDTTMIQSILYNQICGFDVNESALRLAALSLYITAIELNGTARPPASLKFPRPLQGVVLHNHRQADEREITDFVLGSLRPDLSDDFNESFDMVIGNPPWSRLRGNRNENKRLNEIFTMLTREILENRGLDDMAKTYRNPDNNPDLPFLWKAIQWTKPGGIIALALPGRIFLKPTPSGTSAFNTILKGIEITGILNGANLSDTPVWPGMNQPFMLFFARNNVPSPNHHFHFITPYLEKRLNDKGRIRIDYQSAQPIAGIEATKNPRLLKTLSMGTSLDVEVVRKLDDLGWPSVKDYWTHNGLYSGLGYNRSPKRLQKDASFMSELPDFIPPNHGAFSIDVSLLPMFSRSTAHRPRDPELYAPPLLIVPEAPGSSPFSPKSWIVRNSIVFSSSYYGFSAHNSNSPDLAIALLHLITHTDLFKYHVLRTSSKMGAERRSFLKTDIELFPFPPVDLLPKNRRKKAISLSHQLENASVKPWKEINDFIFDVYGLNDYDRQVVRDTLEVSSPFKKSRDRADKSPTKEERKAFYLELQRLLAPSFNITHEAVTIEEIELSKQKNDSPWYFFSIYSQNKPPNPTKVILQKLIGQISEEANKTGCSRVIVHDERLLLVGGIGQYRYWTLSRVRLLALDILRHHLDVFPIGRS